MAVNYIPPGYQVLTPYLQIKNAPAAIEFYKKAFNAKETNAVRYLSLNHRLSNQESF